MKCSNMREMCEMPIEEETENVWNIWRSLPLAYESGNFGCTNAEYTHTHTHTITLNWTIHNRIAFTSSIFWHSRWAELTSVIGPKSERWALSVVNTLWCSAHQFCRIPYKIARESTRQFSLACAFRVDKCLWIIGLGLKC